MTLKAILFLGGIAGWGFLIVKLPRDVRELPQDLAYWQLVGKALVQRFHWVYLGVGFVLLLAATRGWVRLSILGVAVLLGLAVPIVVRNRQTRPSPQAAVQEPPEYTTEAAIRRDGSVRLRLVNRDPRGEPVGWTCEVQDPRFPSAWFHPHEIKEEGDYRVRLEVVYPNLFKDAPGLPLAPGWYMARWKQASFDSSSGRFKAFTHHLGTHRFELDADGQIVGQAALSGWVPSQSEFSADMGEPGIMLTIESHDDRVGVVRCTVIDPDKNSATADNTSAMVPSRSMLPQASHQFLYPSNDFPAKPSGTLVDGDYSVAWFDISGAGEVPLTEGHFTMQDGHLV